MVSEEFQINGFSSYTSNRKQVVSLNGHKSKLANVKCGVCPVFILGPLLSLRISQIPADLVTFTEEILNGKLHFLCSAYSI